MVIFLITLPLPIFLLILAVRMYNTDAPARRRQREAWDEYRKNSRPRLSRRERAIAVRRQLVRDPIMYLSLLAVIILIVLRMWPNLALALL